MTGAGAAGTIPALFARTLEAAPDELWLLHEDERYTYAEADRRIAAAAGVLADRGVRHGTIVMATARNTSGYLFAWLAAMRLGALYVPIDPRSTDAEIAGLAAQTDPFLVLTDADCREAVLAAGYTAALDVSELFAHPDAAAPEVTVRPQDAAILIPTSGTTGRSKLVTQTHRGYSMAGEGFPYWMQLTAADRLMTSLPLFHVNAPAYSVLGSVAARASLVLLPRFSASGFVDAARRYGATEFNAIGAMLELLMRQPERPDDADNPLRLCYTGPSPPRERHLEIEERFGIEIVCGYALSESPYGLIWRHGTRPYGTLGSVRQHPTLGVVNSARVRDAGREVGVGEVGELELSNPALMLGYYGMPEETAEVLVDGWLRTGDLVQVNDDGTFTFVARRKEVIRRRGENLAPAEVEEALERHPDVLEAAVVGVPSELSEEDVKAFVVLREGAAPTLVGLREFAATQLVRFKVPRYLEAVPDLPRTPTGRVAKHQLSRERNDAELDFEAEEAAPAPRGAAGKGDR